MDGVHGGNCYGSRNVEGERILEYAVANNLVVAYSHFIKRDSHLVTFESGGNRSQIDCILGKKRDLKLVRNCKVIPNEECVHAQHKLLVCDPK